ncbi:MAG: hypothetical protein HYY46_17740 [Deltaproteobacteria bacterium]|nr:hypothetical protein [Deltaproteobacteria bacterium]
MAEINPIQEGQILTGPLFNEPMRVEMVRSSGPDTWELRLVGVRSEKFRKVNLTTKDLASLTIQDTTCSYDGDGQLLRLGLQAYALGIAYEFDPYFGLSISRVRSSGSSLLLTIGEDKKEASHFSLEAAVKLYVGVTDNDWYRS